MSSPNPTRKLAPHSCLMTAGASLYAGFTLPETNEPPIRAVPVVLRMLHWFDPRSAQAVNGGHPGQHGMGM